MPVRHERLMKRNSTPKRFLERLRDALKFVTKSRRRTDYGTRKRSAATDVALEIPKEQPEFALGQRTAP